MALKYQPNQSQNMMSSGSLSSMIDIIFLLIIFFVVTASFDAEQLDDSIILPKIDKGISAKALPLDKIIINIFANGAVKLGFYELKTEHISAELPAILKKVITNKDATLIINADGKTKHKYVKNVLNIIAKNGHKKVHINSTINAED